MNGVFPEGAAAVIGGPAKSLKTHLAIDLAFSLAAGTPFLTRFPVPRPRRVMLISGESGQSTLAIAYEAIGGTHGLTSPNFENFLWSEALPRLDDRADVAELAGVLRATGVEIAIVDPLYFCSGSAASQASNLFVVGGLLRGFIDACLAAGATPVFVRHTAKTANNKGVAEAGRAWPLVGRREPYEEGASRHLLAVSVGGSAGQFSAWTSTSTSTSSARRA